MSQRLRNYCFQLVSQRDAVPFPPPIIIAAHKMETVGNQMAGYEYKLYRDDEEIASVHVSWVAMWWVTDVD